MAKKEKKRKLNKYGAFKADCPSLLKLMAHLLPNRTDCEVFLHDTIDITELLPYIEKKNKEHPEYKTTLFHCILFALTKMVNERNYLNRYFQGRTLYERSKISLGFVAKRHFADGAEESLMFLEPDMDQTLDDISKRVYGDVSKVRNAPSAGGLDKTIDTIMSMPKILSMAFIKLIRIMDFWCITPKSLTEGDPNYATLFLTNLGSIKCPAVYHHLNNYGTNSIMIAIGTIHKEERIMPDGTKQIRDVVDFGATVDERIADGFYFIRSLRLVKHICSHPELFDEPVGAPSGFDFDAKQ